MNKTQPGSLTGEPGWLNIGDHLLISEGDYSDYQVIAFLKMEKAGTDQQFLHEFHEQCELRLQSGQTLAAFLIFRRYATSVPYWEINVSDAKGEREHDGNT